MASGDSDPRDESVGELFKRLTSDMTLLMREEFDLLRAEMTEKGKRAGQQVGQGAGMLSAAAICGLFALLCFTATVIVLLAQAMPVWVATLIPTVVYGVIAAVAAVAGKHAIDDLQVPVPRETIETVKEDVEWAKTRMSSARR